jgi:hypothetical protein
MVIASFQSPARRCSCGFKESERCGECALSQKRSGRKAPLRASRACFSKEFICRGLFIVDSIGSILFVCPTSRQMARESRQRRGRSSDEVLIYLEVDINRLRLLLLIMFSPSFTEEEMLSYIPRGQPLRLAVCCLSCPELNLSNSIYLFGLAEQAPSKSRKPLIP